MQQQRLTCYLHLGLSGFDTRMFTSLKCYHFVLQATLERGVEVCNCSPDMVYGVLENETLTMAMGLLTALMTGAFTVGLVVHYGLFFEFNVHLIALGR